MTLEQATERAQAAAAAGDLASLREALQARARAIREVRDPMRLKAALVAGESIARDLRLFQLKLSIDRNRLAQIQSALLAGFGGAAGPGVNYEG
jgi:hypothetical protein